jgi:dTDP-4-amino-4,6-dideoxygalactose transaminase
MNNKKILPFSEPIYITRPIFPSIREYTNELKDVWKSQWLSNNGPKLLLLEKNIKKVLDVPHVSLFNNGTIALLIAIKALKLTGEVITTPFTFPATPHCLTWNNITPVFCDIDPITMNIDADKIESLITKKTTAILAVHVFGTPCDVEKIQKIADKYKLKVIYDSAHAFGTKVSNVGIGNFGDISMFSFHSTKLFHSGEGGALTYKDRSFKERVDLLKNFGIRDYENIADIGINGKMNELQAAMGLTVLHYVDAERKKRKLLYDTYMRCLKDIPGITVLEHPKYIQSSFQYFVIRINEKEFGKSRDCVYNKFKNYNVFTRKYFYPLCSEYPHYKNLSSSKKTNLPVAHKVVNEVLSMPFYGGLSVRDVEKICAIIISFR